MDTTSLKMGFKKLTQLFNDSNEDDQNKIISKLINSLEYEKALLLIGDHGNPMRNEKISANLVKRYLYLAIIKNALMSQQSFVSIADTVLDKIFKCNLTEEATLAWLAAILSNFRAAQILPPRNDIFKLVKSSNVFNANSIYCHFEKKQLHYMNFINESDTRSYIEIFKDINNQSDQKLDHISYSALLFEYSEKTMSGEIKLEDFELLEKEFQTTIFKEHYECNYYSILGFMQALKKNNQKSSEYFAKALTLNPTASEKSEIVFWKEHFSPGSCSPEDLIFLKCSPLAIITSLSSFNLYNHNTDRRFRVNYNEQPYFKKLLEDDLIKNCWHYDNDLKSITREEYIGVNPKKSYIDFTAGVFKTSKTCKIISAQKLKTMKIIWGCSNFGAHELLLVDLVYEQEFFKYKSGKLRIKNIVNQINKLGIVITRKNNRYYYDFAKNNFDIIFPIDHKNKTFLAHISKSHSNLSLKILMDEFKIKKSTASLYLKTWKDLGYLTQEKDVHRGEYEIDRGKLYNVERFFENLGHKK